MSDGGNVFEAAGCEAKQAFRHRDEAERVAARLRRRHGARVRAYQCSFCGAWHIGGGR